MTDSLESRLNNKNIYISTFDLFQDKESTEKIYSMNQIKRLIQKFRDININFPHLYGGTKIPIGVGDSENRIRIFINSLSAFEKIKRDGKYHNPLCEYAICINCSCWCGEKYHGLKGNDKQGE